MHASRLAALALLAALGLATAAEDGRDLVVLREGRTMEVIMESEAADKITYRTAPNAQPSTRRIREVLRIEYAGMAEDAWKEAVAAREEGRYADAAEAFASIAGGEEEWRKVYGGIAAGDSLEQAGKPAEAAEAFAAVAKEFPAHRLWADACYRQGMALVRAGKDAGAVADALAAAGKKINSSAPEYRAFAIRTAMAMAKTPGDERGIDQLARKALLRADDDGDTWFHFNRWLAESQLKAKRPREAVRTIDAMLPALAGTPARRNQVLLTKAVALAEEDPQGAIVELLRIDVLPAGPEALVGEARWTAGRLLAEQADAARKDSDPRRKEQAAELEAGARFVLRAALAADGSPAWKPKAKELLAKLEPKPTPKPAAPASAAATATPAAAKPAATPAAAKP